jgi:GntR family transcriptional regulator, transcriptional repressor for pyruvate dehydrogenase complex
MKELFTPITPKKIADEITAQIQLLIFQGTLKPGQKLPAERELAQWLNVSRTSLRDALNDLQGMGLVETQRGNRTFVRPITTCSVHDPFVAFLASSPENVFKLFEVRKHLEVGAASLAAERATEPQIRLLEKQLVLMQNDIRDNHLGAKTGIEFHILVAEASHNELHLHLINTFYDLLQEPFRKAWGEVFKDKEGWMKDLNQHKAIVKAIKEHDASAAENAVRVHLEDVEKVWKRALGIP